MNARRTVVATILAAAVALGGAACDSGSGEQKPKPTHATSSAPAKPKPSSPKPTEARKATPTPTRTQAAPTPSRTAPPSRTPIHTPTPTRTRQQQAAPSTKACTWQQRGTPCRFPKGATIDPNGGDVNGNGRFESDEPVGPGYKDPRAYNGGKTSGETQCEWLQQQGKPC